MTNQIAIVFLVSTNAINVSGDFKRESGTNFVKQASVVTTNMFVVESHICYTSNLIHQTHSTNGPTLWVPVIPPSPLPINANVRE